MVASLCYRSEAMMKTLRRSSGPLFRGLGPESLNAHESVRTRALCHLGCDLDTTWADSRDCDLTNGKVNVTQAYDPLFPPTAANECPNIPGLAQTPQSQGLPRGYAGASDPL